MERQQTILIVDDSPENIDVLIGVLRDDYRIKAGTDGERALAIARKEPRPDMILLDIMMPGMDGYEVCRLLKADPTTKHIPVIFITAMTSEADEERGLSIGAVDYITKPINPAITKARVKTHLALYDQNVELEHKVEARTKELHESRLEIIRHLGRAAEYRDNETGMHIIRMSHYSRLIAEAKIGTANAWTDLIFQAAPMHDVGKIGIPDKILLKPGKLDADEWDWMKKHSEFGAQIIGEHDSELLRMAKEIALAHHEKGDGSGYPAGLEGEAIPLSARIVAIADVFDALTTERPYKRAWEVDKAIALIDEHTGTHFDPSLVPHFHAVLDEIISIKKQFPEPESNEGKV